MFHTREVRDSIMPDENPMVSRYYSGGPLHPQPEHPQPLPPSRSWSPIPSVHRESFPEDSHHRQSSMKDQWDDDDLTPTSPQQRVPFKQIANSRYSTVASIGQQPSQHELRYIEYPATPVEHHPGLVCERSSDLCPP